MIIHRWFRTQFHSTLLSYSPAGIGMEIPFYYFRWFYSFVFFSWIYFYEHQIGSAGHLILYHFLSYHLFYMRFASCAYVFDAIYSKQSIRACVSWFNVLCEIQFIWLSVYAILYSFVRLWPHTCCLLVQPKQRHQHSTCIQHRFNVVTTHRH